MTTEDSSGHPRLGRRLCRFAVGTVAVVALLTFGVWGAAGSQARARHRTPSRAAPKPASKASAIRDHRQLRPQARTFRVSSGATIKLFDVSEPAGEIRTLRMTVPHGVRVRVTATIPKLAGVSISTPRPGNDPSELCRDQGRAVVCTQTEEACPMPMAVWHFRLHKLAGPAGEVRLEFAVR